MNSINSGQISGNSLNSVNNSLNSVNNSVNPGMGLNSNVQPTLNSFMQQPVLGYNPAAFNTSAFNSGNLTGNNLSGSLPVWNNYNPQIYQPGLNHGDNLNLNFNMAGMNGPNAATENDECVV